MMCMVSAQSNPAFSFPFPSILYFMSFSIQLYTPLWAHGASVFYSVDCDRSCLYVASLLSGFKPSSQWVKTEEDQRLCRGRWVWASLEVALTLRPTGAGRVTSIFSPAPRPVVRLLPPDEAQSCVPTDSVGFQLLIKFKYKFFDCWWWDHDQVIL